MVNRTAKVAKATKVTKSSTKTTYNPAGPLALAPQAWGHEFEIHVLQEAEPPPPF